MFLIYEKTDGVAKISLNRPEVYHALHPELISEITAAVHDAWEDDTIRAVLLTAEGSTAFCSGADLKAFADSKLNVKDTLLTYYNPMVMAIRNIPKPVICRLNGLAAGAGASLALSCDMVIAPDTTYFAFLFVQLGLMPDAGANWFLPRLIGSARAFELATTGRKIYAPEAKEIGLIAHSVSPEKLNEKVSEVIQYYRHAPTQAVAAMKKLVNQSFEADITTILNNEAVEQQKLSQTADFQEGIKSFLTKTKPNFSGK